MSYLDAMPMAVALRELPHEFEIRPSNHGSLLVHKPSKHKFYQDAYGELHIFQTQCSCSTLRLINQDALRKAYGEWRKSYWEPLLVTRAQARAERHARRQRVRAWLKGGWMRGPETAVARINREFASHFRPGIHRVLDRFAFWHRAAPAPSPIGGDD